MFHSFIYNWTITMAERTNVILANFKQIHEAIRDPLFEGISSKQAKEVPEGMTWITRNDKVTNCVKDEFSSIHGHGGPCNCGLMMNYRKRFTSH
jgi:hypothetical protein